MPEHQQPLVLLGIPPLEPLPAGDGNPVDVSAYTGITFWAKGTAGNGNQLTVHFNTTAVRPLCGICSSQCYDAHSKVITLSASWTQYTVLYSELAQMGFGQPLVAFDPHLLIGIDFGTTGSWDYWLDDVAFLP